MPYCALSEGILISFGILSLLILMFSIIGFWIKSSSPTALVFGFLFGFIAVFVGMVSLPYMTALFGCSAVIGG